ncbi:hypothetical protein JTB14_019055, partial [Gonioctena quinquepunctata]
KRTIVKKKLR